jgi:hypothetical protein
MWFLELLAELTLRRVVDRAVHHTGGSFAHRRGLIWRCPSCGNARLRRRRHAASQVGTLFVFATLLVIAILLAGASAFILGWAILAALGLAKWYVEAPIWACLVLGPTGLAVSYLLVGIGGILVALSPPRSCADCEYVFAPPEPEQLN